MHSNTVCLCAVHTLTTISAIALYDYISVRREKKNIPLVYVHLGCLCVLLWCIQCVWAYVQLKPSNVQQAHFENFQKSSTNDSHPILLDSFVLFTYCILSFSQQQQQHIERRTSIFWRASSSRHGLQLLHNLNLQKLYFDTQ